MSIRSAVYSLLATDGELQSLGVPYGNIWPAQAMDTAPRSARFLILRWEEVTRGRNLASQTTELTIWAHCPREMSTDFDPLDLILDRCTELLKNAPGITEVRYNGKSADFNDEGYKTITKNAAYTVVAR